jgi:hypothetical protein
LLRNHENAITVITLNVERYTGSAKVYDSLGGAFEYKGDFEKAVKNYAKAVKLGQKNEDPNSPIYKTKLDRVSGK